MTEQALPENGYFQLGDYYIDVGDNRVFYQEQSRHLEPKAMHVLYQLALSAGETVSRQDLMDTVWSGRVVIEDALTRIISQLRLTFNDSKARRLIQTVPKKGYRLTADVSWLTRQEFIARSAQPVATPDAKPSFNKHKMFALATMSITFLLLLWVLFYYVLLNEANEPATNIANTLPTNAQQKIEKSKVTLAFLVWRNLTGDDSNDYLAEMLPEELSITLAKSDNIAVLAHHSNFLEASSAQALESAANAANVDYWVEGSITEANEKIRVLVRLVDKSSSKAIWSEVYADDMLQLLQLNARIISDIHTQLFGQGVAGASAAQAVDIDIDAYKAYLQGNYWWMNGKTSEWYRRAESSFLKATELAPNFAAAFGSLAFIYARYNYHDVYMDRAVAIAKAQSAIESALAIDPFDTNAMLAEALLAIQALNFERAEHALNKVLELEPSASKGLYVYSELALARNQMNEALRYANEALSSDPLSPWINVNKAIVHYWRNEMSAALAAVEQSIKIDSNYTWAYVWKAKLLEQSGQLNSAIDTLAACLDIDDGSPVNSIYLAMLYKRANNMEQAERWFEHTASLYGDSPDARFWQSYLSLIKAEGDQTIARQLLEQLTIKTTRFFSVEPFYKTLLMSERDMMETMLTEYLSGLQRSDQGGYWVNYHNQYRAYTAIAFMQQLNNDAYANELTALIAASDAFEQAVPVHLRAHNDVIEN